jgi:hypothetical protein
MGKKEGGGGAKRKDQKAEFAKLARDIAIAKAIRHASQDRHMFDSFKESGAGIQVHNVYAACAQYSSAACYFVKLVHSACDIWTH